MLKIMPGCVFSSWLTSGSSGFLLTTIQSGTVFSPFRNKCPSAYSSRARRCFARTSLRTRSAGEGIAPVHRIDNPVAAGEGCPVYRRIAKEHAQPLPGGQRSIHVADRAEQFLIDGHVEDR